MTIDEIYGEMLEAFRRETGRTPAGDGDLAVRLYAVAAQIHALYVQAGWVERQCFPQTAQGEYLDRHAQLRGLERRGAVAARGVLRFETDTAAGADLEIPAGTVCMTAGLVRFATTRAAVLPAGQTAVDAAAQAVEPGAAGNVEAGTVRAMAACPVGISRCTNPAAFAGGTDAEGDAALRARVLETFKRMPNGANAAFYQQAALSFPEVAAASVLPRARGVGTVDVVVSTPAGAPDAELLGRLEEYLQARREIAVDVAVKAPALKPVEVSVGIAAAGGRDFDAVAAAVRAALEGWFDGALLGRKVLRAELGRLVFGVDGVENYVISAPAADVAVAPGELPRLGRLGVTALEGGA